MGARFKLEHANIMAYITSRSYGPPRVLRQHLVEFLDVLSYEADRYLIPELDFEPWPEEISNIARRASSILSEISDDRENLVVPPPTVGRILEELQTEFAYYPLYAIAVGAGNSLQEKSREIARAPMYGQLLVLIHPGCGSDLRNGLIYKK